MAILPKKRPAGAIQRLFLGRISQIHLSTGGLFDLGGMAPVQFLPARAHAAHSKKITHQGMTMTNINRRNLLK
ncbi:MAG: hypothetical protein AAFY75_14265, partial [Pseudomonadota bacterium]